jgi:hypothetical protein
MTVGDLGEIGFNQPCLLTLGDTGLKDSIQQMIARRI